MLNHAWTEHEGAGRSVAPLLAEPEGEIVVEDLPRFVFMVLSVARRARPLRRTSAAARFPDFWSPVVL